MKTLKRSKLLFLFLSFILCAIIGLSFIPYNKTVVKADTTNVEYRFSGSNVFLPFIGTDDTNGYKKGFYLLDFQFFPLQNQTGFTNIYQVNLKAQAFYVNNVTTDTFYNQLVSYASSYSSISKANHNIQSLNVSSNGNLNILSGYLVPDGVRPDSNNYRFGGYAFMSVSSDGFVPNITKIELGSSTTINQESPQVYNYVRYYDINNNFFQFSVETSRSFSWDGVPFNMVLEKRIYYVGDNTTSDYDSGYYSGFNDGEKKGFTDGRLEGVNIGKQQGYSQGFNEGVASANNYSFLGLMTSTIDAPLQVFTKMFDFNLLGVNMSSFYLSLFTACIIIIILKKVL